MTNQIAPSLAGELEQAQSRLQDIVLQMIDANIVCPNDMASGCIDCNERPKQSETLVQVQALLTRAAALARAAETLTTLLHDIAYSGPSSTVDEAHAAEMALRALVSSEGGK